MLEKPVPEPVIAYLIRESLKVRSAAQYPRALYLHWYLTQRQAIDFCHDKAVIHRDIKGANILMTMEGQVKLSACPPSSLNHPLR